MCSSDLVEQEKAARKAEASVENLMRENAALKGRVKDLEGAATERGDAHVIATTAHQLRQSLKYANDRNAKLAAEIRESREKSAANYSAACLAREDVERYERDIASGVSSLRARIAELEAEVARLREVQS